MTALAPHLSRFLLEHLPRDRRASPHTCEAYAYSFQLLVCFAANRLKIQPSQLEIEHLDASMVLVFLEHIEIERRNSIRTRNARLAAVKAFFRYLESRVVSCLDQACQVHAIPSKKSDDKLIETLTRAELQALLDAPDLRTITGLRDRAMLHLAFAGGLRVSELVGLRIEQIDRRTLATIHVLGKGRRERVLPLWKETAAVLKAWLAVRPASSAPELFLNASGKAMTASGFAHILAKHVSHAAAEQPSIAAKRITPHVLRHACAMHMLQATRDIRKVSLWLGHASLRSTEIYLRADPTEKLETLMATTPPSLKRGQFKAPDTLVAMLRNIGRQRQLC